MNTEMQSKLAKYMQDNGYYNTEQIRKDEGASEMAAKFLDIFGGFDEDTPEQRSELLEAAVAYNNAKSDAAEQVEQAKIDTVLSADELDWNAARELGLTEPDYSRVDGEDRPMYEILKHSAINRRNELRPVIDDVTQPHAGDPEITRDGFKLGDRVRFIRDDGKVSNSAFTVQRIVMHKNGSEAIYAIKDGEAPYAQCLSYYKKLVAAE
jgi:hypothetical protein